MSTGNRAPVARTAGATVIAARLAANERLIASTCGATDSGVREGVGIGEEWAAASTARNEMNCLARPGTWATHLNRFPARCRSGGRSYFVTLSLALGSGALGAVEEDVGCKDRDPIPIRSGVHFRFSLEVEREPGRNRASVKASAPRAVASGHRLTGR